MKRAAFPIIVSCFLAALFAGLIYQEARAVHPAVPMIGSSVVGAFSGPNGYAVVGMGSVAFAGTGTTTLCLSGTAATSIPCSAVLLSASGASCLVGSTTAAGTVTAGTSAVLTIPIANVNQLYVTGGSACKVGYMCLGN